MRGRSQRSRALDPDLRALLAGIAPADRLLRQHVYVELSLFAAKSTRVARVPPDVRHAGARGRRNDGHGGRFARRGAQPGVAPPVQRHVGRRRAARNLLHRDRHPAAQPHEARACARRRRAARRREPAAARPDRRRRARRAASHTQPASTDSVQRLLERTLGLVCIHAGWPIGHLWLRTAERGLEPSGIWHCEEPGRYRSRSARRPRSSDTPRRHASRTRRRDARRQSGSTRSAARPFPARVPPAPTGSRPGSRSRSSPTAR